MPRRAYRRTSAGRADGRAAPSGTRTHPGPRPAVAPV